jgi:phosphoglycerol transferase MdoB-like AlkP superfamily enzyme
LGLAVVLIMYFLMVLANTAGFSYRFWNEPAPNDAADRFAVLSLLALAISVVLVGYVVYGAFCVMFLDARRGGTSSTFTVLRRSRGMT